MNNKYYRLFSTLTVDEIYNIIQIIHPKCGNFDKNTIEIINLSDGGILVHTLNENFSLLSKFISYSIKSKEIKIIFTLNGCMMNIVPQKLQQQAYEKYNLYCLHKGDINE